MLLWRWWCERGTWAVKKGLSSDAGRRRNICDRFQRSITPVSRPYQHVQDSILGYDLPQIILLHLLIHPNELLRRRTSFPQLLRNDPSAPILSSYSQSPLPFLKSQGTKKQVLSTKKWDLEKGRIRKRFSNRCESG